MANPNIANLTDIRAETANNFVGTSVITIVANASGSHSLYKINSVILANNVSSSQTFQMFFKSVVSYAMYKDVVIPVGTTFLAVDRDMGLYLNENESLTIITSSGAGLAFTCNYEIIKDT